jgi:hypothetical protein
MRRFGGSLLIALSTWDGGPGRPVGRLSKQFGEALHDLDRIPGRLPLVAIFGSRPDQQVERVASRRGLDLPGEWQHHLQPHRRRQRDVRAGHGERHRGPRCRDGEGDLASRQSRGDRRERAQLLGEPGSVRPATPVSQRRKPDSDQRAERRDDYVVRQQRPGGPASGAVARGAEPASDQQPGSRLREPGHHLATGAGRGVRVNASRRAGVRRAYRQDRVGLPQHSASRRVRVRHVAGGRVQESGRRSQLERADR